MVSEQAIANEVIAKALAEVMLCKVVKQYMLILYIFAFV